MSQTIRLSIIAAALLFVSSHSPLARKTCTHYGLLEPPRGMAPGGEAQRRLHFRHGPPPPPPHEKRDAVSHMWALSPLVTTDWADGRQVMGAWSVA